MQCTTWLHHRRCRNRLLLSLIGHLHHAVSVVQAGRPFVHRMIETSRKAAKLHHFLRLDQGFY